ADHDIEVWKDSEVRSLHSEVCVRAIERVAHPASQSGSRGVVEQANEGIGRRVDEGAGFDGCRRSREIEARPALHEEGAALDGYCPLRVQPIPHAVASAA